MVSGMATPSRSNQPFSSVHRAGVPWETRVLDISKGKSPCLDGDPGVIAFIFLSYDVRYLLFGPGYAPVGALLWRGKQNRFELAVRSVGLAGQVVVDRLQLALRAQSGDGAVDLVNGRELDVVADHRPVDVARDTEQLRRLHEFQVIEHPKQFDEHGAMRAGEHSIALFAVEFFPGAQETGVVGEFFVLGGLRPRHKFDPM